MNLLLSIRSICRTTHHHNSPGTDTAINHLPTVRHRAAMARRRLKEDTTHILKVNPHKTMARPSSSSGTLRLKYENKLCN